MEQREVICLTITEIIRRRSETGQLVQLEEILTDLTGKGLLKSEVVDQRSHFEVILRYTVEKNEDLNEISGGDGILYYYSVLSLSDTYARILIQRGENPLLLMAQIVRENSAIYPRPVPLDIFMGSPFDLTQEEIFECLRKMGQEAEYQDIAQTTTSVGTIFLYSNQHLDPGHASMLAEWLDVGQANNP